MSLYTLLQIYFLPDVEILPVDTWTPKWAGAVTRKRQGMLSDLDSNTFNIISVLQPHMPTPPQRPPGR